MSTKTLRKRIALVAVSAMGFGLLSSVAANAAVTAITNETIYMALDNAQTTAVNVPGASAAATQGAVSFGVITSSVGTGTATAQGDAALDSNGITLTTGQTASATVYPTAELGFAFKSATKSSIVLSGGAISKVTGGATVNGTSTAAVFAGATAQGVIIKPSGVAAGSSFTVSAYTGANISTSAPTNGVLAGIFTITVAGASTAGTLNSANTVVAQQAAVASGAVAAGVNSYDTSSRMANGKIGIVYLALQDAYKSAITTGTIAVTATNGSYVNVVTNAAKAAGDNYAATTAFDTAANSADGKYYVYVTQPVANTPGSTTVTITLDGNAVGTKTLNWSGDVAKLVIDSTATATTFVRTQTDAAPAGALKNVTYEALDSAGNAVDWASYPALANATGSFVGATAAAGGDAAGSRALQTAANGYGTTTILNLSADLSGTGTFQLKTTNGQGVTIYSNVWTGNVSKSTTPYTFKAAFDKSSYAPGSIATLTITAADSSGNPIAYGNAATGLVVSVNGDGLQLAGNACDNTQTYDYAGVITCKYAVKNTAGSYVSSVALTNGSSQAPVAITTAVVNTGSSVTNAEVLAAIVKLIASINKQIAALQKALMKK